MTESSVFKINHEAKSSQKRTKEEETSETHSLSENFETSASKNPRKHERKEKIYNTSLLTSTLFASVLVSNVQSHSSLRPKRIFFNASFVEKIFPQIKKKSTFSNSSSLLLQDYPSKK